MQLNETNIDYESIKLNNILNASTKIYDFKKDAIVMNDKKKFIMTIYSNLKSVCKLEYFIIGTFDRSKNVWIWATESTTLNKSLVDKAKELRKAIRTDELFLDFKRFNSKYLVTLTDDLNRWLTNMAHHLKKQNKQILTLKRGEQYIDAYVIENIIYSSY